MLRDRHGESGRFYHTMDHITAMLAHAQRMTQCGALTVPPDSSANRLVSFATFFHDAVYEPTASDNEAQSAALWRRFASEAASSSLSMADVDKVAAYIERTARHLDGDASGDLAGFLDADLAVLGSKPAAYAEYARAVRLEYAHVPAATFALKRAQVLCGFATAPRLYFTEFMRAELDANARCNLDEEIHRLRRRAPG